MTSDLAERLARLTPGGKRLVIAIDGRAGSGKTTLAGELAAILKCPVVKMDHFFLRAEQRTPERLSEPGGNVDRERFSEEVLPYLGSGAGFSYRPFQCGSRMSLGPPVEVPGGKSIIVEGTYSHHPGFGDYCDARIFLDVDPAEQMRRIERRDGPEKADVFKSRWIPMEELYFSEFGAMEKADMVIRF